MFDFNRPLSNGMTWREYIQNIRKNYDQPAVFYPEENRRQWLDIAYGAVSGRQKLNIYVPLGKGPFPVIVWVHGGGWYTGDRSDRWFACGLTFLKYGFAVVSVGYRLADEAVFPQPVEDVVQGIGYIEKHGTQYGLDTGRIGVIGGSAGANIAAHAALRHRGIKAAQLNCSPLDFSAYAAQFHKLGLEREGLAMPEEDTSYEAMYLGGSILELPDACRRANPANDLRSDAPYFLLMHGTKDSVVPYLQSVDFADAVRRAASDGARASLVLIEGGDHDAPVLETDEILGPKLDFFNRHLREQI
jgi:acetyl esterase/lipase